MKRALTAATRKLRGLEAERQAIAAAAPALKDKCELCPALVRFLDEFQELRGRISAKYSNYDLELIRFSAQARNRARNSSPSPPAEDLP